MKQFTRLYNVLPLLAMLCLASCASEELNDKLLPAGKYPMLFTTSVEGQTPTRATTDNIWSGDEQIALAIGNEVRQYTANASSTTLTSSNPFYWQRFDETVSAWYCGKKYISKLPSSLIIQLDQRGNGYKQSDFLYAMPQKIMFNNRSSNKLIFKHLPAKVVIHLKNGDGVTPDEVAGATIQIVNQAIESGAIDMTNGTVVQTTAGNEVIIPNAVATTESYQQSVQALVVPQQMKDKQFIKVTIGKDATARDYYYTPIEVADSNLENGKQYTYNITVKKTGLSVDPVSISQWYDSEIGSGSNVTEATFHITLSGDLFPKFELSGIELQEESNNMYKTTSGNSFSFSFTIPKNQRKGFSIQKGIADEVQTRVNSEDNITYTFSYNNVRSDLWLKYGDYPEVGDYYYADGTFSPTYIDGEPACIGIVFKVGTGADDGAFNYGDKLTNGIRGYVVALTDASENTGAWGIRDTNVDGLIDEKYFVSKYNGYNNTYIVRQLSAYKSTNISTPIANSQYWAFKVASEYSVVAPNNTSGWYLPSIAQLRDIYRLPNRSNLMKEAKGYDFKIEEDGRYWSSTEYSHADAWYYKFKRGASESYAKSNDWGTWWLRPSYVRAILTF